MSDRFHPSPGTSVGQVSSVTGVASDRKSRTRETDRASDSVGQGDGQGVGRRRTLFLLNNSFGNAFKYPPAPVPQVLIRVELLFHIVLYN